MRAVSCLLKTVCSATLLVAVLVLSACGGGTAVIEADVPPVVVVAVPPANAFDIILFVNGSQIPGVRLLPDQEQDVEVPIGNNFELATSGPVAWTVVVGGVAVNAPVGSTIAYGGANILPKLITNARYAASTLRAGAMPNPVVVSLIATSLADSRQEAQLNIVLN
jgi:hypothetical protein